MKIAAGSWQSMAHERIDRRTTIQNLIAIAWAYFMTLPESRREKMVREFEADKTKTSAA